MAKKRKSGGKFFIGLDIGGTKMLAVAVDEKLKIIGRAKKKTRGELGPNALFSRVCDCIAECIAESGVDPKALRGIGVGVAGPVDPAKGVSIAPSHLSWRNFPLAKRLAKRFAVPAAVDNDVNLGTYGEFHFGAARKGRDVLGIFIGTGIGGGLILDGRLHHGASGAAGEIGHVIVDPAGPRCGCGNRGCLQAFAGRYVMAGQLAALVLRGKAPRLAERAGSDLRDIRGNDIARAIAGGDRLVEEVVRREAGRIGVAAASAVSILSPDTLVLGGGLVEAMPKLFLAEVADAVRKYAHPFIAPTVRIVRAGLGDDAVAMGAAKLIAEQAGDSSRRAPQPPSPRPVPGRP